MTTERFSNRMPQRGESFADESRQQIAERQLSFAALAFGLGFGVGVAVAASLGNSSRVQHRNTVEWLGQQLLDSMSHMVPDSWSK